MPLEAVLATDTLPKFYLEAVVSTNTLPKYYLEPASSSAKSLVLVGLGCSCWIGSFGFVIFVSCRVLAGVALNGGPISGDGGFWNCEVLG